MPHSVSRPPTGAAQNAQSLPVLFDSPVVAQVLRPAFAMVSMVLWLGTEPDPVGCCSTAIGIPTFPHEPRVCHSGSVVVQRD